MPLSGQPCTNPECRVCNYERMVEAASPGLLRTIAYSWLVAAGDNSTASILLELLFGDLMRLTPEEREVAAKIAEDVARGSKAPDPSGEPPIQVPRCFLED